MTSREYCFGCELSAAKKEYVWHPGESLDDDLSEDEKGFSYSLILKCAILDSDAPVGELNVVELDTIGFFAEEIRQPIVRLANGGTEQCQLDIFVCEPWSKFRLIKGSGPVYIWGQLIVELDVEGENGDIKEDKENSVFDPVPCCIPEVDEEEDSSEESDEDYKELESEEVDDEELEDLKKEANMSMEEDTTTKKRKTSGPMETVKKAKLMVSKNKMEVKKDVKAMEEDEDDESEEEEEEKTKAAKENIKISKEKVPPASAKKSIKKKPGKPKGR